MEQGPNSMSMHPSAGTIQKATTNENVKQIATAALKNIPGADKLIAKTFSTDYVKEYFPLKKNVNLQMHMGW
jgi:hypothetical protein